MHSASPSLLADTRSGCSTTIILTGGDSGAGMDYVEARDNGNEAATAWMAGEEDVFTEFNATFGGKPVLVRYVVLSEYSGRDADRMTCRTLVGSPGLQKVYIHLVDGNMDGSGYSVTG